MTQPQSPKNKQRSHFWLSQGEGEQEGKQIGIAILGVGRWGVHLLRNFLHHPQAKVIAVVDLSPERLADCREKFSLDEHQILTVTSWKSVRQLQGIDAVVVVTPASTHYPLIVDALQLGYHVLAEKPLTLNPIECLELRRLARQQQRQLFVDHTYLFHPAVERGQQVIQAGQLGTLRYGYASRTHLGPIRQDVDVLWDLAIHDIAIFNYWLEQTPIQVQARGNVWLQPELTMENSPISNAQGLADLVWVTLIYPDGFQAHIHLCWLNPDKQRRLCVVGERGSLVFDEMSADAPLTLQHGYLQQQKEQFMPMGQLSEVLTIAPDEPLRQVCDRFLAILHAPETNSTFSGQLGTELVQILNCLSLSLQQQGAVITIPSLPN